MSTSNTTPDAERTGALPDTVSFTWTAEEIRRVGYRVVDLIAEHLTGLPDQPVFRPYPVELQTTLSAEPAPAEGSTPDEVLRDFVEQVEPYPFGNGHPRFYGWINSPPAVMGIFAEALATAMNPSVAGGNHAAVYLERQVLNWFKSLLGFPPEAMGLLVSGGSMATLTALAVARHVKAGLDVRTRGVQGLERRLTLYVGDQAHSCAHKAAELLGIGRDNVRLVTTDERYRMRVNELESAIRSDLASGYRPMAVVATAGTTNTGAIDPLAELAEVCRRLDVWLHVDGAYGAPAILTDRYRAEMEPVALADSLAVDPHKWMYVPVEAGLVLVRHAAAMRDAFSLVPPYLRTDGSLTGVGGPPWFSEYGFQQTRGFRALKVWMALKHFGLAGYRALIEHDLALAEYLIGRIRAHPDLQLVAAGLSTVTFRYVPRAIAVGADQLGQLNTAIADAVQLGGRAFVSTTTLQVGPVLRACFVNPRSTFEDVDVLVEAVLAAGTSIALTCREPG